MTGRLLLQLSDDPHHLRVMRGSVMSGSDCGDVVKTEDCSGVSRGSLDVHGQTE